MTYENYTLVILDGNCADTGMEYADWVNAHYPEITIDLRINTSGVGGGLFGPDGLPADGQLWDEFCRSGG
jgi:hypothetical protein